MPKLSFEEEFGIKVPTTQVETKPLSFEEQFGLSLEKPSTDTITAGTEVNSVLGKDPKIEFEEEEEFVPRSQEFFTKAKEQIRSGQEAIGRGERGEAIKETGKGILKGIGGGVSKAAESIIEGAGILGTKLGTKIEELKGTVTPEQAEQTFREIIAEPEFFQQDEQTKADILNLTSSLLVPAAGATKAAKLPTTAKKMFGLGAVGAGATATGTIQTEGRLPTPTEAAIGAGLGATLPALGKVFQKKQLFPENLEAIAGKITQGATKDKAKAVKALRSIDTDAIKTYEDLSDISAQKIKDLAQKVDERLLKDLRVRKLDDLGKTISMGGRTIKTNPTAKAIQDLEELFQKIEEPENLLVIKNFKDKIISEGVGLKELNDLSRWYGSVFKSKAFGKTGEPLTGVNAQAFENTRKSLKDAVRNLMTDDTTKILDQEQSNLFRLQELSDKMKEKVNTAQQKLRDEKIGAKIGALAVDIADFLSAGTLRGTIRSAMPKILKDTKLDALEIENVLQKNLAKFEQLDVELSKTVIDETVIRKILQDIKKEISSAEQLTKTGKLVTGEEEEE